MATLNIKVNGKTETCTLYSTKAEAGDNPLSVKVGGKMAYAAMTTDLADSEITNIRVKKNGTVYAVRKSAVQKEITCMLTIGSKITGSNSINKEELYGYSPNPNGTIGAVEPKIFLGDEFVGIEASYFKNSSESYIFSVGVGKNPVKLSYGTPDTEFLSFSNANHAYNMEIPQFNFSIKVGLGYTDNNGFGTKMALPSADEQKRMVNLFKVNAGKSVKVILTVISPPANTDTKN